MNKITEHYFLINKYKLLENSMKINEILTESADIVKGSRIQVATSDPHPDLFPHLSIEQIRKVDERLPWQAKSWRTSPTEQFLYLWNLSKSGQIGTGHRVKRDPILRFAYKGQIYKVNFKSPNLDLAEDFNWVVYHTKEINFHIQLSSIKLSGLYKSDLGTISIMFDGIVTHIDQDPDHVNPENPNALSEMRYVGKPPGVSTFDRSNPAVKKAAIKQAEWYNKFLEADDILKFRMAYKKSMNSNNMIQIDLVKPSGDKIQYFSKNNIESINLETGEVVFITKRANVKTFKRYYAELDSVEYQGRVSTTGRSPFTYKFELYIDPSRTEIVDNQDYQPSNPSGPHGSKGVARPYGTVKRKYEF